MITIRLGQREIPLVFTTFEMIAIQEEIGCTAAQLRDEVFGLRQKDEDDPESWIMDCAREPKKAKKLGKLIRILGNAGLEEDGKEPDLTDKFVMRHIAPGMIVPYGLTVLAAINEGMRMETAEEKKDEGRVDMIIEEEEAKKAPGK